MEGAGEVDSQHALPLVERGLGKRRALRLPRVVDEDGDGAEPRACRVEGRRHTRRIRHVTRDDLRAGAAASIAQATVVTLGTLDVAARDQAVLTASAIRLSKPGSQRSTPIPKAKSSPTTLAPPAIAPLIALA